MSSATCSCCERSIDHWVTLWSHREVVICYQCLDYLNARRSKQIAVHGGAKPLAGFDPIFKVIDVERAVDHYARLGFTIELHDETYAFAHWGSLVLHLARDPHPDAHTTGALYLHVDDADEVVDEWRKAGMKVSDPEDQDYGKREARHFDPDGNLLRLGSPLSEEVGP